MISLARSTRTLRSLTICAATLSTMSSLAPAVIAMFLACNDIGRVGCLHLIVLVGRRGFGLSRLQLTLPRIRWRFSRLGFSWLFARLGEFLLLRRLSQPPSASITPSKSPFLFFVHFEKVVYEPFNAAYAWPPASIARWSFPVASTTAMMPFIAPLLCVAAR